MSILNRIIDQKHIKLLVDFKLYFIRYLLNREGFYGYIDFFFFFVVVY